MQANNSAINWFQENFPSCHSRHVPITGLKRPGQSNSCSPRMSLTREAHGLLSLRHILRPPFACMVLSASFHDVF